MTAFVTHLLDTSAFFPLHRDARVREQWEPRIVAGLVAICPVVELEVLRSVGGRADHDRVAELLRSAYGRVPVPDGAFQQALRLQDRLAEVATRQGASAMDLLIAVTARHHKLKVLHYDRDFVTIAKASEVEAVWVAEPGSVN